MSIKPSTLLYLQAALIAALDTGKYGKTDFDEAADRIEKEQTIAFLRSTLAGDADLSHIDAERETTINHTLSELLGGLGGATNYCRIWQKLGVEDNGLCLVLALVNSALAQVLK